MPDYLLAGRPTTAIEVPASVASATEGWACEPVWVNGLGGITFQLDRDGQRRFVKWAPVGSGLDLEGEAARCRWAELYTAAPHVIDAGGDSSGNWIVAEALPGESAVSKRWLSQPATAVKAIGSCLRELHDDAPAQSCPFTWSVTDRVERARTNRDEAELHRWPEFQHLSIDEALDRLATPPPVDRLVVCHGDACSPNTLIGDDGRPSGRVDLGALGVADRWADLAVATWSSVWNFGPGWEDILIDAYGILPDPVRTEYYRLLWALA